MLKAAFLLVLLLAPQHVLAQVCPSDDAALGQVRLAIDDFIRKGRAPAGADCAYSWASGYAFGTDRLSDEELKFFRTAADVQRAAARQRLDAGNTASADVYLKHEIELRQDFIKQALTYEDAQEVERLRARVKSNLSYVTSALALRRQYEKVTDTLGDLDPGYVDQEALKVWLQALWSCSNWDGQKANLCTQKKKDICRDKITTFLTSFDGMGANKLPPQTMSDITGLRKITTKDGCLQ